MGLSIMPPPNPLEGPVDCIQLRLESNDSPMDDSAPAPPFSFLISSCSSATFFQSAAASFIPESRNPPPPPIPGEGVSEPPALKYLVISLPTSLPKQLDSPGFDTQIGFPSSLIVSKYVKSLIDSGRVEILLFEAISSFRF